MQERERVIACFLCQLGLVCVCVVQLEHNARPSGAAAAARRFVTRGVLPFFTLFLVHQKDK